MQKALALKPASLETKPACFRTDVRFLCRKPCPVRKECLKLVAEWRRYR